MTGLGFSLVAAPLLTLMMGPFQGIVLANLLALLVAVSVLAASWREVDLRRAATLVPFGLLGVFPGVWIARTLPTEPLQTVIGLLTLLSLTGAIWRAVRTSATDGTTRTDRTSGQAPGSPGVPDPHAVLTGLAGTASGFMTATAGVGGPALTVYALVTSWRQVGFAATAQISFASQAALALSLKGVQGLPDPVACTVLLASAGVGLAFGNLLANRLPAKETRRALIVIAMAGALATTVKGALMW